MIQILVADDHQIVRERLVAILATQPDVMANAGQKLELLRWLAIVKFHLNAISGKLAAGNRTKAATIANQKGSLD